MRVLVLVLRVVEEADSAGPLLQHTRRGGKHAQSRGGKERNCAPAVERDVPRRADLRDGSRVHREDAELMENVASGYRDAQDPMISSIAQQQGAVLEEE